MAYKPSVAEGLLQGFASAIPGAVKGYQDMKAQELKEMELKARMDAMKEDKKNKKLLREMQAGEKGYDIVEEPEGGLMLERQPGFLTPAQVQQANLAAKGVQFDEATGQFTKATDQDEQLDKLLKMAKLKDLLGKTEKEEKGQEKYSETVQTAGQTVIRDVTTALDTIDKYGSGVAGVGSWTSIIPGTPAKDLERDIESIKSNVAVDQLLKIKQSGAGLGQVPQSQLNMLASLMGGLDRDMSPQKLKKNLIDIQRIYSDIVRKEGGDPLKMVKMRQQGGMLPSAGTESAARPQTVMQNGVIYTLNPETGEYE